MLSLGLALAVASCASDGADRADARIPRAESADFVGVFAGDSWSDLVGRVADCRDARASDAAVDYLRAVNPVVADVGLAGGGQVAFDPTQLDALGCTAAVPSTGIRTGSGGGSQTTRRDLAEVNSGSSGGSVPSVPTVEVSDVASIDQTDDPTVSQSASESADEEATDYVVAFAEDFVNETSLERFRWQIHHAPAFQGTPESWQGDHDEECGPPSTTRTINLPPQGTDRGEAAYWCAPAGPGSEHLMTSFRSTGYAQVAFSPDESFDQVARVCWNQNMTDLGRKWTQVVVVSNEVFAANDERLDYVKPSIESGPGASGVFLGADEFLFVMQDGSTVTHTGRSVYGEDFRGFVTQDKTRRYRTCLTDLEDGSVQVELERDDVVEIRVLPGAFPDGPARVIFQDDTYNSTKRPTSVPEPFTWHWDDLLIETR